MVIFIANSTIKVNTLPLWIRGLSMNEVEAELNSARQKLLDLTMRNRLLNHRPYKRKSLRIVDEIPREIYDLLVIKQKKMRFYPRNKTVDAMLIGGKPTLVMGADGELVEEFVEKKEIEFFDSNDEQSNTLPNRYTDDFLQTELDDENLHKSLFSIQNNAKTFIEEQGYNVLYLALGFLEWKESPNSEKYRRAPLILIPVEIGRYEKSKAFYIHWTEEEVIPNISLIEKLKEQEIQIPDFKNGEKKNAVDEYLGKIQKNISKHSDWSLINEIYLDFFSFSKFIMFKDLDPENWPEDKKPIDNDTINRLFDSEFECPDQEFIDECDLKKIFNPELSYQVVDADPSQIAVIEEAKNGNSMVVEGPPGTGKSQTITNIIAELLSKKKSILFVSQKMAALQVVKKRLDYVGLGDFCLELHSRKTNKKEFYKELESQLKKNYIEKETFKEDFSKLESISSELDNYSDIMKKPYGKIKKNPLELISLYERSLDHFKKEKRKKIIIEISDPFNWRVDEFNEIREYLKDLSELYSKVFPISRNVWKGCYPRNLYQDDIDDAINEIDNVIDDLDDLRRHLEILSEEFGITKCLSPIGRKRLISNINLLSRYISNEASIITDNEWKEEEAIYVVDQINKIQNKYKRISKKFNSDVLKKDFVFFIIEKKRKYDEFKSNLLYWDNHYKESGIIIEKFENYKKETEFLINYIGFNKLDTLPISKINEYNLLHEDVQKNYPAWYNSSNTGSSILELIKKKDRLIKSLSTKIKKENIENFSRSEINDLKELKSSWTKVLKPKYHKLKGKINSVALSKIDKTVLNQIINEYLDLFNIYDQIKSNENDGKKFFDTKWNSIQSDYNELDKYYQNIQEIINNYQSQQKYINALLGKQFNPNDLQKLLRHISTRYESDSYLKYRNDLAIKLFEDQWDGIKSEISDLKETRKEKKSQLDEHYRSISDLFRRTGFTSRPNNEDAEKIMDEILSFYHDHKKFINDYDDSGNKLLGVFWKGIHSDPYEVKKFIKWYSEFSENREKGYFNDKTESIVVEGVDIDRLLDLKSEIIKNINSIPDDLKPVDEKIHFNTMELFNKDFDHVRFNDWRELLEKWKESAHSLINWSQYIGKREKMLESKIGIFLDIIHEDRIYPEDIMATFNISFANQFLKDIFSKEEILEDFVFDIHEKKIEEFKNLDIKVMENNQKRLKYLLYKKRPRRTNNLTRGSEIGKLYHEINKKRRQKSIRDVLDVCGNTIKLYKPCFMMSPLSIAQFIKPEGIDFDVIIFDEASQVKPEDALGAFFRGKQVIVMGDTKQLPPTSFFDNVVSEDEEKEQSVESMESILHVCKSSFGTKMLKWHYRSNHETLINVSNRQFYDNDLKIYPSPIQQHEDYGLKFIHVPEGVYDRGKSSTNKFEAQKVVDYAFNHFRKFGFEKSLGIGTFNTSQQKMIEEEIESRLMKDETYWSYFRGEREENFFVKNLETIQGDERDVILISVCYGKDSTGKLTLNFGPLNQEGGERRLNVLITRAKDKCVVFSNFRGGDLRVRDTSGMGPKSLKVFLEYAEHRKFSDIMESGADFDSEFERSVYNFIRSKGYEVHGQVGCAGFRVDLGLVNPDSKGEYILGIECDGAKYHSSIIARERDRLRQDVLERMGWNIYRIWSTDWFRNRRDAEKRLIKVIEEVINGNITGIKKKDILIEKPKNNDCIYTEELELRIPEYKEYNKRNWLGNNAIHEISSYKIGPIILEVLELESPIYQDELIKRIVNSFGVKRVGNRIKENFERILKIMKKKGDIKIVKGYVQSLKNKEVLVRERTKSKHKDINMISNEEIADCFYIVLACENPIERDVLFQKASKIFGFKSMGENIDSKFRKVLNKIQSKNIIKINGDLVSTSENLSYYTNKYYITKVKRIPQKKEKKIEEKYRKPAYNEIKKKRSKNIPKKVHDYKMKPNSGKIDLIKNVIEIGEDEWIFLKNNRIPAIDNHDLETLNNIVKWLENRESYISLSKLKRALGFYYYYDQIGSSFNERTFDPENWEELYTWSKNKNLFEEYQMKDIKKYHAYGLKGKRLEILQREHAKDIIYWGCKNGFKIPYC